MSKELLNSLLDEINSGNMEAVEGVIAELSEEQLDALFNEAQPFKALGTASSDKFVLGSVSNLREKYLKKLITTAMVGFLFQMKDEFTVDEKDLTSPPNKDDFYDEVSAQQTFPENFNMDILYYDELTALYKTRFPDRTTILYKEMECQLNEDDLLQVSTNVKTKYDEMTRVEKTFNSAKYDEALEAATLAQSNSERAIIDRFLQQMLKFNADKHTQEGGQEIVDDPERQDINELKGTDVVYDNIPPNDTHCRFNSYYDINYEKLRDATRNIYNVKPDWEHAMIVYDVVDKQADVDAFIHKYGSTSKYDIVSFPLNRWTLMGPFKENRDYFNKHNSIIKSLLEQQEQDAALGEELMKNRVKSKKVKAEKVFGKDSPQFAEYKKISPSELETKYNATIEEAEDNIKVTREMTVDAVTGRELQVDEDGVPFNALEIPITSINARTGETSQTRIFTASKD